MGLARPPAMRDPPKQRRPAASTPEAGSIARPGGATSAQPAHDPSEPRQVIQQRSTCLDRPCSRMLNIGHSPHAGRRECCPGGASTASAVGSLASPRRDSSPATSLTILSPRRRRAPHERDRRAAGTPTRGAGLSHCSGRRMLGAAQASFVSNVPCSWNGGGGAVRCRVPPRCPAGFPPVVSSSSGSVVTGQIVGLATRNLLSSATRLTR
jgi:hypothetical protein